MVDNIALALCEYYIIGVTMEVIMRKYAKNELLSLLGLCDGIYEGETSRQSNTMCTDVSNGYTVFATACAYVYADGDRVVVVGVDVVNCDHRAKYEISVSSKTRCGEVTVSPYGVATRSNRCRKTLDSMYDLISENGFDFDGYDGSMSEEKLSQFWEGCNE